MLSQAEEELNDAGFQEQVDRDTVLKTMSETLEKLLKRLEGKEGTGQWFMSDIEHYIYNQSYCVN